MKSHKGRKLFDLYEVFTPSTPARATFIERQGVNNKLVEALWTPGKQIIIYGHSGSGKTTLLINKLDQLYEKYVINPSCGLSAQLGEGVGENKEQ